MTDMLTVNELAHEAGAPAHVVRYYTRIGLIQPAAQRQNGYRLFAGGDASRLRFIRMAKQLGFTLGEIRQVIEHAALGESPCGDVRRIIQCRIEENRERIAQMQALQSRMESALDRWRDMPDGEPDGNSICHLIESIDDAVDH